MRLTDEELDARLAELKASTLPAEATWLELAEVLRREAAPTAFCGVKSIPSRPGLFLIDAVVRLATGKKRRKTRFAYAQDAQEANELRVLLKSALRFGLRLYEPALGTPDYRTKRQLGGIWNLLL